MDVWTENVKATTEKAIIAFLDKIPANSNITDREYAFVKVEISFKDAIIHAQIKFGGLNMWIKHTHKESLEDRVYGRTINDYTFSKLFHYEDQIKSLNIDSILNNMYENRCGRISSGSLGT